MTVGELMAILSGFPLDREILLISPEMDAEPFEVMVKELEGTTSDGPGTIALTIVPTEA